MAKEQVLFFNEEDWENQFNSKEDIEPIETDDLPDAPKDEEIEEEEEEEATEEAASEDVEESEEKVEEPVREEEKDEYADAITLDDYFAKKKKPVAKKEVRKVEEVKKANLEKVDAKKEKVATIESNLRGMETYTAATAKTEYDNLLGF